MPLVTPNFGYARNERIYAAVETTYGTAVTASNTNCMSHISIKLDAMVDLYENPSKTGSRSVYPGTAGRKHGVWQLKQTLDGSGTQGVAPDCDPVLQAIFGQAPTGTSYSLSDNVVSFSLWRYRLPVTLAQQVGIGCLIKEATFNLGENLATWESSGEAMWVLDSFDFSATDSIGQAGLGSIPTEPASPVTNGTPVAGFTGQVLFAGNPVASVRTAKLHIGINNDQCKDTFGSFYPTGALAGARKVTCAFELYDSDGTDIQTLFARGIDKALVTVNMQVGTTLGNTWTFNLHGGQFTFPEVYDPNARFGLKCNASFAGSSLISKDEVALVIT